jgi:hypothetical protein
MALGQQQGRSSYSNYTDEAYGVSINYPADYTQIGPGSAWFAAFDPSQYSATSFSIFLDYVPVDSSTTIEVYAFQYLDDLRSSGLFPEFSLESSEFSYLGGEPGHLLQYSFRDPATGMYQSGIDYMAIYDGGIYTVSFIGPAFGPFEANEISNIIDTFTFIS